MNEMILIVRFLKFLNSKRNKPLDEKLIRYIAPTELSDSYYLSLKVLNMYANDYARYSLPEFITKCINLERLIVSRNNLKSLTGKLSSLQKLKILDVSRNELSSLRGLEDLVLLEQLFVNDNVHISNFEPIKNLKNLWIIKLDAGLISSLLDILPDLQGLKQITIANYNRYLKFRPEVLDAIKSRNIKIVYE